MSEKFFFDIMGTLRELAGYDYIPKIVSNKTA